MPSFCVVSNCEYKYASAANISFHKFPLNSPELLKKWIDFTDRGPDWFPSKWSSICSRHFLPSDFRIQHLRKCLKRTAAPSVTMKSLDFDSIPANDFSESHYKVKRIVCRLCAKGGTEDQSKSIVELSSTLVKCLPTIRLNILENLPNDVCGDCIKKLIQYSLFIDRVASVQKDFFGVNADDTDGYFDQSTTKPMIIKQEPVANIKQEIFEFNKSTRDDDDFFPQNSSAQDYYTDGESDAYCEFCDFFFMNNVELKNHIVDCHSDNRCNPRERANNCEIMEIITLENAAFIDLDENCVEETTVPQLQRLKVEQSNDDMLVQTISLEHSYASVLTSIGEGDSSIVGNLKQEEMNLQVKTLTQPRQMELPAMNEIEPEDSLSLEPVHYETVETEPSRERSTRSCDAYENENLEPTPTEHKSKTKICPICTAHCRTIYHYFIHRSKYHNWSKPRRPKRKLHFKCSDCSKMFLSKFAFDNHNRYSCSSLRFTCSICHLEFSSGMSMLIHKRICKVLMAKSSEPNDNRRMRMESHRRLINSSGRHGQTLAQQLPPGRPTKSLHHHRHRSKDKNDIRITHVDVPSVNAMESSRPNKRGGKSIDPLLPQKKLGVNNYVSSCGKPLKTIKSKNANHGLITHMPDSPQLYNCNICNKQFRIKSYLYQHLVTHDNERKHKCIMCTKSFKRLAGLNQHIRGYHYKIKPHVCTVCKHRFALKGDMRRCRHSTMQNKT